MVNEGNIADFYAWVTRDVQKANFYSGTYLILMSKIFACIMNIDFQITKYNLSFHF